MSYSAASSRGASQSEQGALLRGEVKTDSRRRREAIGRRDLQGGIE